MIYPMFAVSITDFPLTITAVLIAIAFWTGERAFRNRNNQKKEELLVNSLVERVKKDKIEEVILATSATVEGQTTAFYIQDSLKNTNVRISKLAQGLSVGGEIENLDDGTLISAFKNRKVFKSI